MQFNEYTLTLRGSDVDATASTKDAYAVAIRELATQIKNKGAMTNASQFALGSLAIVAEYDYLTTNRPFYNVYPAVVDCLKNTKMDIKVSELNIDVPVTAVCFAKGHEFRLTNSGYTCSSFLLAIASEAGLQDIVRKDPAKATSSFAKGQLVLVLRVTDPKGEPDLNVFRLNGDDTLDLQCLPPEVAAEIRPMMGLAIGIGMLSKDPDFIKPILLKRDQGKDLTPEQLEKAIARAKRNGRNGFTIGEHMEVSPHLRKPHFAIRWMGEGRTTPRLRPIKGCVVKKSKLYPVPTGYLGPMDDEPDRQ